jgi:Cu(I)/Ag(I) efflux system protein CusF
MKRISSLTFSLLIGFSAAFTVLATSGANAAEASDTKTPTKAISDGEIKKVDKEAGKVTIKHGPLTNLDMPGMTMVFRVKDPAMLEHVKAGDMVKFTAEKVNGAFTVTVLEAAAKASK